MTRHGETAPVTLEAFLLTVMADCDPDLLLVNADPKAWSDAHPCDCEGTCLCDQRTEDE